MTTTQDMWALGDYNRIADLLVDMGRAVVAAAEVGPGMRVLDVASGTGNATLPAAAAGADVVATDVTPALLEIGERHARDRGLTVRWEQADAQALPFADGEFDAVLSCIGAIFAPDQAVTGRELLRVCRPGGIVVMANWTSDGGAGRFFRLLSRYEPPGVDDAPLPTAWGVPAHATALLEGADVRTELRRVRLGFTGSADELAAYYRRHFPPVVAVMPASTTRQRTGWSATWRSSSRRRRRAREHRGARVDRRRPRADHQTPTMRPRRARHRRTSWSTCWSVPGCRRCGDGPRGHAGTVTSTRGSAESRRASSCCAVRCTFCWVCCIRASTRPLSP
jgi:SAM-dependent methyltransferase